MDTAAKIRKAESDIAAILKALEFDTGEMVESVGINEIEITDISDDRPMFSTNVRLSMKPMPGRRWDL